MLVIDEIYACYWLDLWRKAALKCCINMCNTLIKLLLYL